MIAVAFVLAILGVLSIVSGFFDIVGRDSPPYMGGGVNSTAEMSATPAPNTSPETNSASGADLPADPDTSAYSDDFSVIFEFAVRNLSPSDISRGNLILVNHEHSLVPPDISSFANVADSVTHSFRVTGDDVLLLPSVIQPLVSMMDAFYSVTGSDAVSVISGFRGLERQREILDDHIARMGETEARRWVAEPGHSEHHAGLAVDLGFYHEGNLRTFLGVGRTAWFYRHAHYFGFILRYPENRTYITGVAHEPWHFRYVGFPHAHIIYQKNWVLEEYIDFIKQHDRDNPFSKKTHGLLFEIFFTQDMDIFLPYDIELFDVSGTNTNGFIVTMVR